MRHIYFIIVLIFGLTMLSIPTQAMEIEGAYCKFDIKKWRDRQSLLDYLRKGSDCEIVILTEEWGDIKVDTPNDFDWIGWRELFKSDDEYQD
jgi:hypothetical protein